MADGIRYSTEQVITKTSVYHKTGSVYIHCSQKYLMADLTTHLSSELLEVHNDIQTCNMTNITDLMGILIWNFGNTEWLSIITD